MPNTGKPSKDCHLCRSRRVKCDLARPGCQRCFKYGVECPGYRDQQELVFRNASPSSVRKRRKRAKQPGEDNFESYSSGSSDLAATPNSTNMKEGGLGSSLAIIEDPFLAFRDTIELVPRASYQRQLMPMTRALHEHWTMHSIPILLNVYNAVDFVHNLFQEDCGDGPLVWAAHLFSRTYVTNVRYPTAIHRDSETETKRELGKYLGKTLSAVNTALKTPDGPLRDDILATVWILANYELLIGSLNRMEPMSPWHLHARGLYGILKVRGSQSLLTYSGRTAFWPAYNMVQIQALVSSTECPTESEEWMSVIKDTLYEGEGLTVNVSIFISKVAHIISVVFNILRRRDFRGAESQYAILISDMSAAEQAIDTFFAENKGVEQALDSYMHNMYRSAIIRGYHVLQQLANYLTHYPASCIPLAHLRAKRVECMQKIRAAAQEIILSIPSAIGTLAAGKDKSPKVLFDALKLIWPVSAVYIVPTTLPEQKAEAEKALVFIGKELGVRQALQRYAGGSTLPPEADRPLGFEGIAL